MTQINQQSADNETFREARDRLRSKPAVRSAGGSLHVLFSAATISRLLKSEDEYASANFSHSVRERLVWALRAHEEPSVYVGIETMMGQTGISRQIIRNDFDGRYSVFRFIKRSNSGQVNLENQINDSRRYSPKLEFVEEKLRIFFDDADEPAFQYWGLEKDASLDDPEISGAVFYTLGKLFLTGVARDTMSMAIVQATRNNEPMQGFWTSTAPTGAQVPFSARILIVSENNHDLVERLRGDRCEDEFLRITQGGYAFYMTVD